MTTPNASHYLNLRIGALARLSHLRSAAAYSNAPDVNLPPSRRFADWRAVRRWTFIDWEAAHGALSQGLDDGSPIWYCCTGPQFRDERFADEVDGGPDHAGWFSDAECSRKIRGIVARLSHGRFIAGTYSAYSTDNGMRTYWPAIYTDESDAASAADSQAESDAEKEKERDERWREARNLADDCDQLEVDLWELFAMRHHARARRELAKVIETLRTKRDKLTNDYSDIEL